MTTTPPPDAGDRACAHNERREGMCTACGDCLHEVILNGACFICGTTDLDPVALSPKKPTGLISPDLLTRKKR